MSVSSRPSVSVGSFEGAGARERAERTAFELSDHRSGVYEAVKVREGVFGVRRVEVAPLAAKFPGVAGGLDGLERFRATQGGEDAAESVPVRADRKPRKLRAAKKRGRRR